MQDSSEREKLIQKLRNNKSIRLSISKEDKKRIAVNAGKYGIAEEDEYWLLAEHLKYLRNTKRKGNTVNQDNINKQISDVEEYLLIAQFGDRNVGRFNKWG